MMSHQLPNTTHHRLTLLISGIEEMLQADAHRVGSAMELHPFFDARFVESPLTRSLISGWACSLGVDGLRVEPKPNGGAEAVDVNEGVERRFRLRSAKRDSRGWLVVRSSSDSVLTPKTRGSTLFDNEDDEISLSEDYEQWVLAHFVHPGTRTFHEVWAARVTDKIGNKPPYRLELADVVRIPHTAPLPPDFKPKRDDLDLPDEDEDRGEEAG